MNQAKNKFTVFVDCDDTILCSSKAVINILNKRYGTNKTEKDLRLWGYNCIAPQLSGEDMFKIYESTEFWDIVTYSDAFLKVFEKMRGQCEWVIATKGTPGNLARKAEHIDRHLGLGNGLHMAGFPIFPEKSVSYDKSSLDMRGGIQIDDRTDSLLCTSAPVKVLLQNSRRVSWNQVPVGADNFYVTDTWEEIGELLEFFKDNMDFIQSTYRG